MKHYSIIKLGANQAKPRIWLENKLKLESSGFMPSSRYDISFNNDSITLKLNIAGPRKVSARVRREKLIPVVDINTPEICKVFNIHTGGNLLVEYSQNQIKIELEPKLAATMERESTLMNKLTAKQSLDAVSLFTGSGFMDLAFKDGMQEAGVSVDTVLTNEIDERYLDNGLVNNPALAQTNSINCSIEWLHRFNLPKADILLAGYPCVGFSKSGKAKNKIKSELDHQQAGHLFVYLINAILAINPALLVFENVPQAENSTTYSIIETALTKANYTCQKVILDSWDYGSIEQRKRMIFVAASINIKIDINAVTALIKHGDRQDLGSILDKIDHSWSEMIYLKSKEQSDIAAGKGFKMNLVNLESNKVSTIGKGYNKNRSTEPKLVNPTNPNLMRLFTPQEHARIKGFSPELINELPNTTAHEVLGNGVVRHPIQALARIIGEQLISLV